MLLNQKGEPLLVAGSANNDVENPQVVLKFGAGSGTISLRCAPSFPDGMAGVTAQGAVQHKLCALVQEA